MGNETALSGMKAITEFCGSIGLPRTEASILQLNKQYSFPMRKLMGIWESDKVEIISWRRKYVSGEVNGSEEKSPAKKANGRKSRW